MFHFRLAPQVPFQNGLSLSKDFIYMDIPSTILFFALFTPKHSFGVIGHRSSQQELLQICRKLTRGEIQYQKYEYIPGGARKYWQCITV
jgi:hypothetical protein